MVSAVSFRVHPFLPSCVVSALLVAACGSDAAPRQSASPDAGGFGSPIDGGTPVCQAPPAPTTPAASCKVTVSDIPVAPDAAVHVVDETQALQYCSNPPSTGPHYPVWADFKNYTTVVPTPYLVHSMEHGAVILWYRCDGACPEITDALIAAKDAQPEDPICAPYENKRRIIVAPSTTINTKVAASAFGVIYEADCVDRPTLDAFLGAHQGKTLENICNPGRDF